MNIGRASWKNCCMFCLIVHMCLFCFFVHGLVCVHVSFVCALLWLFISIRIYSAGIACFLPKVLLCVLFSVRISFAQNLKLTYPLPKNCVVQAHYESLPVFGFFLLNDEIIGKRASYNAHRIARLVYTTKTNAYLFRLTTIQLFNSN